MAGGAFAAVIVYLMIALTKTCQDLSGKLVGLAGERGKTRQDVAEETEFFAYLTTTIVTARRFCAHERSSEPTAAGRSLP